MTLQKLIGVKVIYDNKGELAKKMINDIDDANEFMETVDVEEYDYVYEDVPAEQIVYVNCYLIHRHYGGPEEGGWYYNSHRCREVIPVQNQYAEQMKNIMQEKYEKNHKHGNIYSVLGGTDVAVYIELEPKQSETTERPHYE